MLPLRDRDLTIRKRGITELGACYLFRHAMAKAMLDNGADIRHVRVMLGHSKIDTTAIYS